MSDAGSTDGTQQTRRRSNSRMNSNTRPIMPKLHSLNPMKLLPSLPGSPRFSYEQLTPYESRGGSPLSKYRWRSPTRAAADRFRFLRLSPLRILVVTVTIVLFVGLFAGGGYRHGHRIWKQSASFPPADHKHPEPETYPQPWLSFERLNGYYNGIRTLVSSTDFVPENPPPIHNVVTRPASIQAFSANHTAPPFNPVIVNPYEEHSSPTYLSKYHPVEPCYLDDNDSIPLPEVFAYPGLPQYMTSPKFGMYDEMGVKSDRCFDRFGRLGPYGYGYQKTFGGSGLGIQDEQRGADKIWEHMQRIDYSNIDWARVQERCYAKNKARFEKNDNSSAGASLAKKERVPRTAFVLRAWTGTHYDDHYILTLRAIISELALKSGGEYDVHLLVQVKDESIPIWASRDHYRRVIEQSVPKEFWNITTLWSEALMVTYYPHPFPEPIYNDSGERVHGVYRSAHFAIQWFSQQFPDYDFYWNWEVDMRYTGHYYEFLNGISEWAYKQPRKGLWERNARYYMPQYHGSWKNFSDMVESETIANGEDPVWGPVEFPNSGMVELREGVKPPWGYTIDQHEWGNKEDADLITFNPIFDTGKGSWVFSFDITGYNPTLPVPPRRTAIITASRLSKRLLDVMHEETWRFKHTAFPEMWPPTVALHHGLKAVFAPHPVYFDRNWPLEYMDNVFNRPRTPMDSVFGAMEHNHKGSTFYYNSGFAGALWRRWLGQKEQNEGGTMEEKEGTGRMCLRGLLFHPIKYEDGPTE